MRARLLLEAGRSAEEEAKAKRRQINAAYSKKQRTLQDGKRAPVAHPLLQPYPRLIKPFFFGAGAGPGLVWAFGKDLGSTKGIQAL